MTTIIFKSEKKANNYQIISTKDQGCYKKGELIQVVRTDDIGQVISNGQNEVEFKLICNE